LAEIDRRRFLALAGGGAAVSLLTPSIARAAEIPAARRTGSLDDVEHVVVLMQENRSFDHYFGTMRGVRGFGDPHPAVLRSGKRVWHQPDGRGEVLPFRPDLKNLGLAFLQDLDHGWETGHDAFADGEYDGWVAAKGTPTTMAHLRRGDVPFHYALADAFTVCDAYHCSLLGPTDPNRYYLWTGWVGNDGKGGGPAIDNGSTPAFTWTTYPERLQQAGVSWKVYQDVGAGLDAAHLWGWAVAAPYTGNYGDNALLYFQNFQNATAGDPLYDNARTGTDVGTSSADGLFAQLLSDVQSDTLPQVSWIAAPEAFTEHPNWPANYGAWYVAQVLDALTSNPDVWARTVVFLTYDENDGFFDHVVPPYPNVGSLAGASSVSLAHEYYQGANGQHGPYGLGVRVPMTVISPWSTGGWVCSETFDHTSIIRFLETRFGVHEPNITPWRRTVCGDLTSAFDFSKSSTTAPTLPSTAGYLPPDSSRHPDYVPVPPDIQHLPAQEAGVRPSRALGYGLVVDLQVAPRSLTFTLANHGRLGAQVQVRTSSRGPLSYTVGAGHTLTPTLKVGDTYNVSLHGPHGFFRRFAGRSSSPLLEVRARRRGGYLVLTLHNHTSVRQKVHVADAYARDRSLHVGPHGSRNVRIPLTATHGWYDVLVTVAGRSHFARALAGRIETGRPSISDPQLGR
jgi:phospholipase C